MPDVIESQSRLLGRSWQKHAFFYVSARETTVWTIYLERLICNIRAVRQLDLTQMVC